MNADNQSSHQKLILLADADPLTREAFSQAMGEEWQIKSTATGTAALIEMEKHPADVIVASSELSELDGGELLNRIQGLYPKAIRFIAAQESDRERVIKQVLGAHQFLSKPFDTATLKNIIEGACALENWVPRNSIRDLVRRIRTLPTMPTLYQEVLTVLRSPDATTEQVGAIIAKDMAMTTKLLQVLNSAWFGASRKISDPSEAVGILGFETVSSMVMTIKLLSQYDKVKPVYFSIDRLWKHSTEVARVAKQLTLLHTEDHAMAEAAFTGGLLHDLGKVVLASNFDEQYRGAQSLAAKQKLPPTEVEKEIFGANHGEIGAYLLGLWGMPLDVLEIAALHHQPSQGSKRGFTPLTAVHVANALIYEMAPEKDGTIVSVVDEHYLEEIGVLEHLPEWREAVQTRNFNKSESKPRAKVNQAEENPGVLAMAPKATVTKPPSAPKPVPMPELQPVAASKDSSLMPWVYRTAALAAVIVVVCLGIHFFMPGADKSGNQLIVHASTRAETPEGQSPEAKPAKDLNSLPKVAQVAEPVAPKPAPVAAPAPAPAHTDPSSNLITASAPAPKPAEPVELKLQGIIYSSHPSAIVNGKTVHVHDRVADGGHIAEINVSSIVISYTNHSRTLSLK